jgi:hypothetical protein
MSNARRDNRRLSIDYSFGFLPEDRSDEKIQTAYDGILSITLTIVGSLARDVANGYPFGGGHRNGWRDA